MSKTFDATGSAEWPFAPPSSAGRRLADAALRRASRTLARWARTARRLVSAKASACPRLPPELEFYAEAGAPEGALYVDGQYLCHLPGVTRL